MSTKGISFIILSIVGLILPFIPEFALLEVFCLLIPFAIFVFISFCYLIITLIRSIYRKKGKTREALFIFSLIPCFLLSQIGSTFIVGKVQRERSKSLITELESLRQTTGIFPDHYPTYLGITYIKESDQNNYRIEYSRGFLVREVYARDDKSWISYGWRD